MSTGSSHSTSDPARPGRPRRHGADGSGAFPGQGAGLCPNRLGTAGLLQSVLAATAPLMVVAGVMPTMFGVMGIVGQPLLFVVLGVVIALFSCGYAEMSRHVHNAGALYSYLARGLGGTAGAGAAMTALAAYSALQMAPYGLLGYEVSGLCATYLHISVDWWIPALAAVVVVSLLGWMRIDFSARLLGTLLFIEVALVVVFDAAAISHPGAEGLSLHAFDPETLGGAGVGTALCFCVAAFLGFEQAPVYLEETQRAQVVVIRVMFLAIGTVMVFFAVSSWAFTVLAGPSQIVPAARGQSAGLLFALAGSTLGGTFTDVLHVLYVTGIFASTLSFHNVVARYAFTMGREGLLPAVFGRTGGASGAPVAGSMLQSVLSVVVVVAFAMADGHPAGDPTAPVLHLFTWMGNVGALGVTLLMAVACLAVIVFFVQRGAARPQAARLAASAVAGVALLVIVGYTVRDFDVLVASGPGSLLRWVLPGIIALAAVTGLVQGALLRRLRPWIHSRIGLSNRAFLVQRMSTVPRATDPVG